MENFLSLTILVFLLIYLSYELFFSKRKKQKRGNTNEQGVNSATSSKENNDTPNLNKDEDESMNYESNDLHPASDEPIINQTKGADNTDSIPQGSPKNNTSESILLKNELDKIEDIITQGLYGKVNQEICLKEIQKIISNLKLNSNHD